MIFTMYLHQKVDKIMYVWNGWRWRHKEKDSCFPLNVSLLKTNKKLRTLMLKYYIQYEKYITSLKCYEKTFLFTLV
jgi:hypothetical protein